MLCQIRHCVKMRGRADQFTSGRGRGEAPVRLAANPACRGLRGSGGPLRGHSQGLGAFADTAIGAAAAGPALDRPDRIAWPAVKRVWAESQGCARLLPPPRRTRSKPPGELATLQPLQRHARRERVPRSTSRLETLGRDSVVGLRSHTHGGGYLHPENRCNRATSPDPKSQLRGSTSIVSLRRSCGPPE